MTWQLAIWFLAGLAVGVSISKNSAKRKPVHRVPNEADTEKIMSLFVSKDKITNDNVENLLKVSDATATRYLNRLVRRKLIKQRGKGRGVHYVKND